MDFGNTSLGVSGDGCPLKQWRGSLCDGSVDIKGRSHGSSNCNNIPSRELGLF